jgi:hypothetical protein
VRLGRTTPQIFGIHPEHGTSRLDWCGLMITGGHKAIGTDQQKILFGNVSGYRDTPGAPTGSPAIFLGLRVLVIGRAFPAWSAK